MEHVLISGGAGYVGSLLCPQLLRAGYKVTALDACYFGDDFLPNDDPNFTLVKGDIRDSAAFEDAVKGVDMVIHLACISNDASFQLDERLSTTINLDAFEPLVAASKAAGVRRFIYASTSSVYGANEAMPFIETERADTQLTIYAATKKANESMAHSYAHLWDLPTTMFRFFTVYGPWGRPDLAYYKFVDAILDGRPIDIYNHGDMYRDFTHVGDLVRGIRLLVDAVPQRPENPGEIPDYDSLSPVAPFRVAPPRFPV